MASVQELYVALLGRPVDPEGLKFWQAQTKGGTDYAPLAALASSFEFINQFPVTSYENYFSDVVTHLYDRMFDRAPDPEGLAYFVEQLQSGKQSIQTIALHMMDGAQGQDRTVFTAKVVIANAFTQKLDTPVEVAAYHGDWAVEHGRGMLNPSYPLDLVGLATGKDLDIYVSVHVNDLVSAPSVWDLV